MADDLLANLRRKTRQSDPGIADSPTRAAVADIVVGEQHRRYFDRVELEALSASVAQVGVKDPIVVRPHPQHSGKYELVLGERRLRSAIAAGKSEIEVKIESLDDVGVLRRRLDSDTTQARINDFELTESVLSYCAAELSRQLGEAVTIDDLRGWLYAWDNARKGKTKGENSTRKFAGNSETIESVLFPAIQTWAKREPSTFVRHNLPLLVLPEEVLSAVRRGEIAPEVGAVIGRLKDTKARSYEKERGELLDRAIALEAEGVPRSEAVKRMKEEVRQIKGAKDSPSSVKLNLPSQRANETIALLAKWDWKDEGKRKKIERLLSQIAKEVEREDS